MMKIINTIKIIYKIIVFVFIVIFSSSCNNHKRSYVNNRKSYINYINHVEARLNDSLSINIYINRKNNIIQTITINNKNTKINNIYGFHNDGITPSFIGRERDGARIGPYYTYYSNGILNNKINYVEGKIDGEYVSYSDQGEIVYKAYYENGVEKDLEVGDTTNKIEIKAFSPAD